MLSIIYVTASSEGHHIFQQGQAHHMGHKDEHFAAVGFEGVFLRVQDVSLLGGTPLADVVNIHFPEKEVPISKFGESADIEIGGGGIRKNHLIYRNKWYIIAKNTIINLKTSQGEL